MGTRRVRIIIGVVLTVVLAFVLAWGVLAYRVIGHPHLDRPTAADAVIVLGPADVGNVIPYADSLISAGLARTLLVSTTVPTWYDPFGSSGPSAGSSSGSSSGSASGSSGGVLPRCHYQAPAADVSVECFVPDPTTTAGEARTVSALAARNHWTTLIVVTPTYHVARARLLFRRCFAGHLAVVAPSDGISLRRWAYETVYQSVSFVKAELARGC